MVKVNKLVFPVLLVVLIALLFVGGPEHYSGRVYRNVWDLGHVLLFAVFTIAIFRLDFLEKKTLFIKFAIVFFLVITFALLSECLQSEVSRTAELADIRRDLVGALLGVLIVYKVSWKSSRAYIFFAVFTVGITAFEFSALVKSLVDECDIYQTKAVLSNLEGIFEDDRWKGNSQYDLSEDYVIEGEKSLRVIFNTDEYSGITLKYMYRNWKPYNLLHVSVFNPGKDGLLLNVRINDFFHIRNNRYNDRYNEEVALEPGWNKLVFSVQDIKYAPEGRETNLENMQSFGMFVTNASESNTIYIDNIYLD